MSERAYIYANRYKTGFPAILKMADRTPMENGQAMVSAETRAVDFASDFVPLFKMGTPLVIARTFVGEEIHIFRGTVYLSSEKLLRITSVREELVPGTEKYYMFPVSFPALIRPLPGGAQQPRRFTLRRQPPQPEPEQIPVTVTGLAADGLEFSSPVRLPEGVELRMSMDAPIPLDDAPLEVWRMLQFGSVQSCSGRIRGLSRSAQRGLEEFIHELHLKNNRFFR